MTSNNRSIPRRRVVQGAAALACTGLPMREAVASTGEIVIGQSAQLSGPFGPSFAAVARGQALAIQDVNARGGINGRQVKFVALDDAYDPQRTADNVRRLIDDDKAVAIFGLASTGGVTAALPLLADRKVPLICSYSGSPSLRRKFHPYFFTTMASYEDEVVQMLRNLKTLTRTQVGLVYQNSAFGQLMMPVVEAVAKEVGVNVVVKATLEPNGSDAVAAVQAVAAAKPQAVVYMSFGPSTVPFLKAAKTYLAAPLYCIAIANSKQLLSAVGDDARGLAFTQTVPYPWRPVNAITRDFNRVMAAAGIAIDYDHFFGYLNVRVLLEALRRVGGNVTPAGIVKALEGMRKVDIGGYVVDYSPTNHHGSRFVEICIVGPNGKYLR